MGVGRWPQWCVVCVCVCGGDQYCVVMQLTANGKKIRLFDVDAEEDDDS